MGFILLSDALRAIDWLLTHPSPVVQSVGAGSTPLTDLLRYLAEGQGRKYRPLNLPVPPPKISAKVTPGRSSLAQWGLRLAYPRSVVMEPPVAITPLNEATSLLLARR